MKQIEQKYIDAVQTIKTAILKSQYNALKSANREQIGLYYSVGRFISTNSRNGYWGTGALDIISGQLKAEMPGLMGFSTTSMKNMRKFYEAWSATLEDKSAIAIADLQNTDNQELIIRQSQLPNLKDFPAEAFLSLPFTHHIRIIEKVKDEEERLFYIQICNQEHYSVKNLLKAIQDDDFGHKGKMPNNFMTTISDAKQARKAIRMFKDEYMLDFLNTEELDADDIEDVNERIIENSIVKNIKDFILKFGRDFLFIASQYEIEVLGHKHLIDLLFYNRELGSLVAIELKKGPFKNAYLGQLNGYLRVLDDEVRKPNENPTVGIVLCRDADQAYVEYVIKDYNKPMGVATYKTANDLPEKLRNALPDADDLKKLL